MEIDIAQGHEDKCGFIEYMVAPLSRTGVSEVAVTEDIHPYLVVAEYMDSQFLQLELVFL